MTDRTLHPLETVKFGDKRAVMTLISKTDCSAIAVWGVKPGQEVPAHTHPDGQDTWVMLQGELTYYLGQGEKRSIRAGDVDVADHAQVHGAINEGTENAVFVSIYSAPQLGWAKATP